MKKLITLFCFILVITGSMAYASPQQTNKVEDKILHKTLDELTKDLGKPVGEETIWGGGVAIFKLSDSLYYSCYFKYPDSKCYQYMVSDSNPLANHYNLNADALSSELLENAFGRAVSEGKPTGEGGYGTWDLGGRDMIGDMPKPSYKGIQEEGRVVVTITVSPNGEVIGTRINNRTNTTNKQMRNAAEEAARKTKFNSISGTENQTGTIIYYFKLK